MMNALLTPRRAIAWLVILCLAAAGVVILRGYVREYNAVSDFLLWVKDSINRELAANGVADLGKLRRLAADKGYDAPLIWARVELLSENLEYEGRIVCCFPKRHFRRLSRATWGLAIIRRDTEKGKKNRIVPHKFTGSADFIREKIRQSETES